MIYKIAFIIVGLSWFGLSGFLQFKLVALSVYIRQRNGQLKKTWTAWGWHKQLRKLERETNDEQTRIAVRDFFKYSRISGWIVVGGLILMLLIGFLNAWQNGTGK